MLPGWNMRLYILYRAEHCIPLALAAITQQSLLDKGIMQTLVIIDHYTIRNHSD